MIFVRTDLISFFLKDYSNLFFFMVVISFKFTTICTKV